MTSARRTVAVVAVPGGRAGGHDGQGPVHVADARLLLAQQLRAGLQVEQRLRRAHRAVRPELPGQGQLQADPDHGHLHLRLALSLLARAGRWSAGAVFCAALADSKWNGHRLAPRQALVVATTPCIYISVAETCGERACRGVAAWAPGLRPTAAEVDLPLGTSKGSKCTVDASGANKTSCADQKRLLWSAPPPPSLWTPRKTPPARRWRAEPAPFFVGSGGAERSAGLGGLGLVRGGAGARGGSWAALAGT